VKKEEQQLQLHVLLTKVDVARRQVWGIMVDESPDKSGEAFDYTTSKAYFEEWSDGFKKATDGKSLGNVREMHLPFAAGKVISIEFDDVAKCIRIGAEIVDDDAWKKVEAGVYTGFSIGGGYMKRWTDPSGRRRYTAKPAEVSLVDNPCVPSATFTLVKADGSEELRKFADAESETETPADPAVAKDLTALIAAATGQDAGEGTATTPLAQAAEALADAAADGDPTVAVPVDMLQALHNEIVGLGARCVGVSWMDPDYVDRLANSPQEFLMQQIHAQLVALGAKCPEKAVLRAAEATDLEKTGRVSEASVAKLQQIHDHAAAMGAVCKMGKAADPAPAKEGDPEADVVKAAPSPEIADLRTQIAALTGDLTKATGELAAERETRATLAARLQALEDQPAGDGPALTAEALEARAVEKALGGAPSAPPAATDEISRLEAIVHNQQNDPVLRQRAGRQLAALREARGPLGR
jgi:hypothetical protein